MLTNLPTVVRNLRLDLVNPDLVKSMLRLIGKPHDEKIDSIMSIINAIRESNPEVITIGDLLRDVNMDTIGSLVSLFGAKEGEPEAKGVICGHCGHYIKL